MLDIVGEASGGTDPSILQLTAKVVSNEMKAYKAAAALSLKTKRGKWSDLLDWWRANHHKFPIHAKLARILLAN